MTTHANASVTARSDGSVPDFFRLRWMFIALIVVGGVVNYLDRSTLSIGNTTIAKELGFSAIQMGLLLSAFSWPYALANLPAGYLIDRFGVKKMFMFAIISWSVVAMGTSFLSSFAALYVARMLLGICESPFFASGLKASQLWFAKQDRALPVSTVNTGSQIGNAVAPPFLTFLMLAFSWRDMFLIVGALGIVLGIIWWFMYRDPRPEEERVIKGSEELDAELAADAPGAGGNANWFSLLKRPNTWFMMLGAFGIFYTVWVYLTWLPSYLQTSRGFSLSKTGWVAALPFLCGICGVLLGGWISSRLVARGWPTIRARKVPIVCGAILAAAAVLPVAYVQDTTLSVVLLCIGYFAAQIPIGCIWTLASDVAERHLVASLGAIQNFGGFLGAAVAPVVTGAILQRTGGNFQLVFVVAGLLLLVGAMSYGLFVRDRRPLPLRAGA